MCGGTTEANRDNASLVRSVLSQVQAEFSLWSWTYSRKKLRTLSFPSSAPFDPPGDHPKVFPDHPKPIHHEAWTHTVTALQRTYSPDGDIKSDASVPLEVIDLIPALAPHPPYESCAPLSRSVFRGDDPDAMAFIPYADDPLFNQTDHTLCYGSFSWQEEFDPDRELQRSTKSMEFDDGDQGYSRGHRFGSRISSAHSSCVDIRKY